MFYCLHFVIVCVCFNFKIFCCLIRLPKQDEDYMGGNHLDLLVGFPNNHQVVSGVTLSNFWIHSWENFGKIMYVLYYFNGLCYWVWSIHCIFCPFLVFLCTTSIIPHWTFNFFVNLLCTFHQFFLKTFLFIPLMLYSPVNGSIIKWNFLWLYAFTWDVL